MTGGRAGATMDGQGPSRRRFLTGAAATGVGVAAGFAAGFGVRGVTDANAEPAVVAAELTSRADAIVPFYGERQAGIDTAQQERLMFAALDVTTSDVEELKRMLGRWAAMAARMTEGKPISDSPVRDQQPPFDTGEATELAALGTIPGDAVMRPELSDGDLCIQACADDPQVVFHAVRNLVRSARGVAVLKWSQLGFG